MRRQTTVRLWGFEALGNYTDNELLAVDTAVFSALPTALSSPSHIRYSRAIKRKAKFGMGRQAFPCELK